MKLKSIITSLQQLGIHIARVTQANELTDAAIELAGRYDGIGITVGTGYYSVRRMNPSGTLSFWNGRGNLKRELALACAE
jgi:hypothetical protein